ncbi:MAG: hypothetical protein ACK4WH_02850 [Phycisphaerales bacterium]
MSDLIGQLLHLDRLRFGDPGVEFGFTREIPLWGWAGVVIAAALLGWLGYRRLEGSRAARFGLGSLRALTLIALAVILAGPRLVRPNEIEEPDWVLVLVDRSSSLSVKDAPAAGGSGVVTREQQLREALEASRPIWNQLGADRVVVWMGFDATAWEARPRQRSGGEAAAGAEGVPDFGEPVGRRTDLNRALDAALRRAAARPLSGVVVLSDGRSVEPPSRAIIRRLEAEKVPVFTLALGSARGLTDLGIRHAEAPRTAFVNDTVPVVVELERLGPVEPGSPTPTATLELIDNASGAVLDSREVAFDPADKPADGSPAAHGPDERRATATLVTQPSIAGRGNWSVRVRPAAGQDAAELVEDNNRVDLPIELVDRPLRVMYLDGYPRWEYRYLKNVLVREATVSSVVTMLAPGRRYIQEGTETIDALPASPEEWAAWDVLVIGDVWPGVFTVEQLHQIRERVATAGLGLVWIAGEGSVPDAWRGSPLADLVPFTADAPGTGTTQETADWGEPIVMAATPAADALGVLRLAESPTDGSWWPQRLSDPATGWSQLRWAQRIDRRALKPTTEVLAVARPALAGPDSARAEAPLVMSMRFGAGRVVYVATDEIWRWRYGRGEFYTERFWLQIVRLLGRESVARSGKPAVLQVTPDRAQTDRPVRVELTLIDQSLVDARPSSLKVRVRRAPAGEAASGDEGVTELTLTPENTPAGRDQRAAPRTFSTTWIPTESGRFRVEAADPLLASAAPGAPAIAENVQVWQPDDEMRQPQADHALLADLSKATGGKALTVPELQTLPSLLPNRRLKLAGEPDIHTLWDTPLALILVVVLLTAEWIGRRLLRLA